MSASVTISGDIVRVHLRGDFDFSSQEELGKALDRAVETGAGQMEIDLEETTFIDSSVLRLLLRLNDRARGLGKSLLVTHCNERVIEIFRIGGFDQILDIR